MSEHDTMRELLPLAAAGALEVAEQAALDRHLAVCAACAGELENWQALGAGLKRLPTPMAPQGLVERTRFEIERELVAHEEERGRRWTLALLVLFSWAVTLASWPIVRLLSGGVTQVLELHSIPAWVTMFCYTTLAWLAAGVAALVLGKSHQQARRLV